MTTWLETEVVIIGGGATGTGIMRDCALRGIKCILIEKDDLASGTMAVTMAYFIQVHAMRLRIQNQPKNVLLKTVSLKI